MKKHRMFSVFLSAVLGIVCIVTPIPQETTGKIMKILTASAATTTTPCSSCYSTGKVRCSKCSGTGSVRYKENGLNKAKTCDNCNGKGKTSCLLCGGKGFFTVNTDDDTSTTNPTPTVTTVPTIDDTSSAMIGVESTTLYTTSNGDEFIEITKCFESATKVVIPAEIDGVPVISIGDDALSGCTKLTSITIPDSVTVIGNYAFEGCTSLTSITLPDSVTLTGNGVFSECTSLTSITIPESITSIKDYTFSECTSLASITIPDSVTSIGYGAFAVCTSLASITIPDSVTNIEEFAFYECTSLTSITIPDSVTSIGTGTFNQCTELTSITIPDSVTSIGNGAFYQCTELTSIIIPDNVTSIDYGAFCDCTSLTEITILNPDCEIDDDEETISDTATIYGYENSTAQEYAEKYGRNFVLIDEFSKDVLTYENHGSYIEITGCDESATEVVIPAEIENLPVTIIGDSAFYECENLTSITIPDSVISIGNFTFQECTSLTEITIPDSVISIGNFTFRGCTSLTEITIPDSVTSIGNAAFCECIELTTINIPDSVTSIGSTAFYGCTGLTSITIPDSITSISLATFYECTELKSITIPESVTSIEEFAFLRCTGLTSITILNPDCEIVDNENTISNTATIYGYENSTAQAYAKKYNRKFVTLSTEFEISDSSITLKVGEKYTIVANQPVLAYGSGNDDVAVVSRDGVVTAVGEGVTSIAVMNNDEEFVFLDVTVIAVEDDFLLGDCNNDGKINIADIVILQKWLLAEPNIKLANWKAADLCEDGIIDIFDLVEMRKLYIQKG